MSIERHNDNVDLPEHWTREGRYRFERVDGAVVRYAQKAQLRSPTPEDGRQRQWKAFPPLWYDDSDTGYLAKDDPRTAMAIPRKWKYPESAMQAVDEEFEVRKGACMKQRGSAASTRSLT